MENTIQYELTPKKVKNIIIRVKANGAVTVTMPYRMSKKKVDAFVQSKAAVSYTHLDVYKRQTTNNGDNGDGVVNDVTDGVVDGAEDIVDGVDDAVDDAGTGIKAVSYTHLRLLVKSRKNHHLLR